jgi:hypothetical protein
MHIEAPEVRQLRNDVYFGLEDRFRLGNDTGGIGYGTILLGEDIRSFEEDFRSPLKGPALPRLVSFSGYFYRLFYSSPVYLVSGADYLFMPMWGGDGRRFSTYPFAADKAPDLLVALVGVM